jgi:hypothetical protein
MVGWAVFLVYAPWEVVSEPPLALLLAAFVAAWALLIDFLVHLKEDWERANRGTERDRLARLGTWFVFLGSIALGVALLVSGDTVERVLGLCFLVVPAGGLIYAFVVAAREVLRSRRNGQRQR